MRAGATSSDEMLSREAPGVLAARGFLASGVRAGLKAGSSLDVAVVAVHDGGGRVVPRPGAAVFTRNLAAAAPVLLSRSHLKASGGQIAAVVLNAGNANAATGREGDEGASAMAQAASGELDVPVETIMVCSTGLIGVPFPTDLVVGAIPAAVARLGDRASAAMDAASAIMTTDTVRKLAVRRGEGFTVGGMAKGAAMLSPDLATMLAVCTTDAPLDPGKAREMLVEAVRHSFNELTVDGCTSTNDTVIFMSSGLGRSPDDRELQAALAGVCEDLAEQMAADAEGATKVVRILIKGASSDADASRAARRVADSLLVKCSLNGSDPYWGRIVSELGSAGVAFSPDRTSVSYGGVTVASAGVAIPHDEEAARAHMDGRYIDLACDLGLGNGQGGVLTVDLGDGYLAENRGTS